MVQVRNNKNDIPFRIDLVKRGLASTEKLVKDCDLAPLKTPNLIESFGSVAGNLTLISDAIDGGSVPKDQVQEFENLRNRYFELARDFTYRCTCTKLKIYG